MSSNTTTDKEVSTEDQPDVEAIHERLEARVEEIREAGGRPVIEATDGDDQTARFVPGEGYAIVRDNADFLTIYGTAVSHESWPASIDGEHRYPDGWNFDSITVTDGHDRPTVHYHQGEDLAPVGRMNLPEDVRAKVDVHRDHARELGARELEVRHYGDGVFDVIHRHGGLDGGEADGE